tara:strand:- start:462 stop:779 length:318 start_codon:yes stop_codon:yes gene_type:complete
MDALERTFGREAATIINAGDRDFQVGDMAYIIANGVLPIIRKVEVVKYVGKDFLTHHDESLCQIQNRSVEEHRYEIDFGGNPKFSRHIVFESHLLPVSSVDDPIS